MARSKSWREMTVDERLEVLKQDQQAHQREVVTMAQALDELRRRVEEVERRLEDSFLS